MMDNQININIQHIQLNSNNPLLLMEKEKAMILFIYETIKKESKKRRIHNKIIKIITILIIIIKISNLQPKFFLI